MQIFRTLDAIQTHPTACAMGMFDGIHLGHRMVLEQALRQARLRSLVPTVFTFANHPQSVVSQTPTPLLSDLSDRIEAFEALGFAAALILDFTPELKALPAETFVQHILCDTLHVQAVSIGYDHRFGKDRHGDGAFLQEQGTVHGFTVDCIDPVQVDQQIVSSTLIRKLLSYGDLGRANRLLGYPYQLQGKVVSGDGRGRGIGFPTANLALPPNRLVPAVGVYAGRAWVENEPTCYPAVCNIGHAPTFGTHHPMRMEVHLLQPPPENLYGQSLTFAFYHHLRSEQTFPSVTQLVAQIQEDCRQAQQLLERSV